MAAIHVYPNGGIKSPTLQNSIMYRRFLYVLLFVAGIIASDLAINGLKNKLRNSRDRATLEQHLLQNAKSPAKARVVCLGGSTTAGGGGIAKEDQYCNLINSKKPASSNIESLQMGHGGTSSFFAASLFSSFVPIDTNIIIWEFTQNDYDARWIRCSDEMFYDYEPFSLRYFMQQVSALPSRPRVIMLLLWDTPFTAPRDGGPGQHVHDILLKTIENHPLILGVIDASKYIRETCLLVRAGGICGKEKWVVDTHHASKHMHYWIAAEILTMVTAFEKTRAMYSLDSGLYFSNVTASTNTNAALMAMSTEKDAMRIMMMTSPPKIAVENPLQHQNWTCNDSAYRKEIIERVMSRSQVTVSWTAFLPAVEAQPLQLIPFTDGSDFNYTLVDKAVANRIDRHRRIHIPPCGPPADANGGGGGWGVRRESGGGRFSGGSRGLTIRIPSACKQILGFMFNSNNASVVHWEMDDYKLDYHHLEYHLYTCPNEFDDWVVATQTSDAASRRGRNMYACTTAPPGEQDVGLSFVSVHCGNDIYTV